MNPRQMHYETLAATVIRNLSRRQMDGFYCTTIEEAEKKAFSFLTPDCTVAFGGSMTLADIGMLTALRHNPHIRLLDRAKAASPEETKKIYHDALSADFYFMSTNAITADGELVNIDGTGNRVAALIYGPENVIIMAGMNKVTRDVSEALSRVHNTATDELQTLKQKHALRSHRTVRRLPLPGLHLQSDRDHPQKRYTRTN